jgi:phenylalanyl-tRNA synthetase alpha chain
LTQLLRSLGTLAPEERPQVGAAANEAKRELEGLLDARLSATSEAERRAERSRRRLDLTLPGRRPPRGSLHPLTRVHDEIVSIFAGLGFSVVDGPEIESDYHNFEALNIPRDHPARDMQDTFYVSDSTLLRTHTSPVQIRAMLAQKPPVRIIVPGRVYRRDVVDMTHSPMFHQVEGLWLGENVSFRDLKAVYLDFMQAFFETSELKLRFRPSYFPFTEPSAEIDLMFEHGPLAGRWLEVSGSGQVHPQVVRNMGFDPERIIGFAFGSGIDRLAMLRYGIDDLRLFFDGDLRFLRQFA